MASQLIFISSVQKEMTEERQAIKEYVAGNPLLRRYFTTFLFEDLPAMDRRTDEVYLDKVDSCGMYVGLFGNEYGYEDSEGISPTEREFDRATRQGKPRIILVKGADDKARHPKMRALIHKASDQLIRRRFCSIPELTTNIYASLVEHLERNGVLRTVPFDAASCPGAGMGDISEERIRWFLSTARSTRGYATPEKTSVHDALAHLNLLADDGPSHAAVLLFGKDPQRFLVTSEVKCMHFHDTEVQKPIPSYQIYKGTVFELVDQSVDFILSKIARTVGTRTEGPQAPVNYEVPRAAVAEAIVNAVAHRDYASSASVQVMLFGDRLEVWNPGELPPPLTPELLRVAHASIPRNPLLFDSLFLTRYSEKAGSGILDMIALCRQTGLREPDFRQDGGQFVQTLWRPRLPDTSIRHDETGTKLALSRHQVEILQLCREETGITDLMRVAGRSDRTKFRNLVIDPLLKAGLIEMTVPEKPRSSIQKYRLTAAGIARLGLEGK
jgi:ATP-dependent DNA helicase RecG